MDRPRFYVYNDHIGKWHWKFFAPVPPKMSPRPIAKCEDPFDSREECERAIEQVRELGLSGQIHYAQSTS